MISLQLHWTSWNHSVFLLQLDGRKQNLSPVIVTGCRLSHNLWLVVFPQDDTVTC